MATSTGNSNNYSSACRLRSPTKQDAIYFRTILDDPSSVNSTNVVFLDISDDGKGGTAASPNEDSEVELDGVNTDWTNHYRGHSRLLVKPKTVDQVSAILRYCSQERLGVVPQGGKTGLVGGGVPISDEVILSLSRLNQIHGLDARSGILHCQAGCILQDLHEYCHRQYPESPYLVPIDLGSRGSCQIGGNLSTNAGGQYYYRYGSLAGNILGLQVVLADGSVLNLNYKQMANENNNKTNASGGGSSASRLGTTIRSNLKDNTGYKLHQLFVGAEGTLGIITGIALWCPPFPASRQTAVVACQSFENVLDVMQTAKTILGETLAALEWMDQTAVDIVVARRRQQQHSVVAKQSDGSLYPHYLLVESHGSVESHDQEKMSLFLECVLEGGTVSDGTVAQDGRQRDAFWSLRESCNPSIAQKGYTYKYDLSLPVDEFADFIDEMRQHLSSLSSNSDSGDFLINPNW